MTTAILIVSYRTPDDIADCLSAIDQLKDVNDYGVFIVENGGADAYLSLLDTAGEVCAGGSGLDPWPDQPNRSSRHLRTRVFTLPLSGATVWIAEANDNLGYAGGVNSWLEPLAVDARWDGFWILNPDTAPEPMALASLIAACAQSGRGMAGSVILDFRSRGVIVSRGMRWRHWRAAAISVDHGCSLSFPLWKPKADIDAPSGASFYVTRACLKTIGFMNEDYFLYFEDLEWGLRAKAAGLLCRADGSFVPHKYGSALGSAKRRGDRSSLSVYLDARNTLLFTKCNDPGFLAWAFMRSLLKIVEFYTVGSARNGAAAFAGVMAGVRGELGKPDWYK